MIYQINFDGEMIAVEQSKSKVENGPIYVARYNLTEVGTDVFAFAESLPGGLTVRRRLPAQSVQSTAIDAKWHTGEQLSGSAFVFWDEKDVPSPVGVRGAVKGFSRGSRRRMTKRIMRVPFASFTSPKGADVVTGLFACLTYPKEYTRDHKVYQRHLDVFIRRLKRNWPYLGSISKLEFQKRGAPHFHLVVLFKSPVILPNFRAWLSQAWYEVVDSGDEKHLEAGTEAHGLYIPGDGGGAARLMQYLCKYITKESEADFETGRVWGWRGEIPTMSYGVVTMNRYEYEAFLNCVRQHNKKSKFLTGMSALQNGYNVFGDGAELVYWFDIAGVCVESDV